MQYSKNIGFSTGSLAYGDFREGIALLRKAGVSTVEISALREKEFSFIIASLDDIDLRDFTYVSFHAPSRIEKMTEEVFVGHLMKIKERGWPIIVHPDTIVNFTLWQSLGECLCLENMDKRKHTGRTVADLEYLFDKLPEATFCLDLAHARQVDPTMLEAMLMAKRFKNRLIQLHISDVRSDSKHEALNMEAILAFQKISAFINKTIPCILESPVMPDRILAEIILSTYIFDKKEFQEKTVSAGVSFAALSF